MTSKLIEDLKRDEGLVLKAYPDPLSPLAVEMHKPLERRKPGWARLSGHPWTIGYGHTGLDVYPGLEIAESRAEILLINDEADHSAELLRRAPWVAKLDPVRQDVLKNMAFNLGVEGLLTFKNTLAAIRSGDYERGAVGMAASKWAQQVGARATRLIKMMRTGAR